MPEMRLAGFLIIHGKGYWGLVRVFFPIVVSFFSIAALHPQGSKAPSLLLLFSGNTNGYLEACPCSQEGLGGLARRATLLKTPALLGLQQPLPSVLRLDAGNRFSSFDDDTLIAHHLSDLTALMRYDALNIGWQDARFGWDFLERRLTRLPLLSTNLAPRKHSTLPQYRRFIRNGLSIAVLGVMTASAFQFLSSRSQADFRFSSPLEAIDSVLTSLKNPHPPDLLVLLIDGYDLDFEARVAARFPEISIILTTSEGFMDSRSEIKEIGFRKGRTLIATTGHDGEALGFLLLSHRESNMQWGHYPISKALRPDREILSRLLELNRR